MLSFGEESGLVSLHPNPNSWVRSSLGRGEAGWCNKGVRAPSSTVQHQEGQEKTWSSSWKEVGGVGGGEGFRDGKVISRADEAEVRSGSP